MLISDDDIHIYNELITMKQIMISDAYFIY
jgi:hypothetical protein